MHGINYLHLPTTIIKSAKKNTPISWFPTRYLPHPDSLWQQKTKQGFITIELPPPTAEESSRRPLRNLPQLLKVSTQRIIGPYYRGVWLCVARLWDLQTTSFEIPRFLGHAIFMAQRSGKNRWAIMRTSLNMAIGCMYKCITRIQCTCTCSSASLAGVMSL